MLKLILGPILVTKVDRLSTYASALAYCFVLSMIPFLVVTFTLASKVAPNDLNLAVAYKDLLRDILPLEDNSIPEPPPQTSPNAPEEKVDQGEKVADLSAQIVATLQAQTSSSSGLATIGFLLAVYTSYNLMDQIVRTLIFIFDDPRRPEEWTWMVVIKTLALLGLWMSLLLLISIFSVLTPVINHLLHQVHLNSMHWRTPLLVLRDVVAMLALFGAFFVTYYLVPVKRHKMKLIRNGALVASCGWLFCSLLFANVLPRMWHANAVYEALGSVVIVLLWALACAWSVIIGACWIVRFSPRGSN